MQYWARTVGMPVLELGFLWHSGVDGMHGLMDLTTVDVMVDALQQKPELLAPSSLRWQVAADREALYT